MFLIHVFFERFEDSVEKTVDLNKCSKKKINTDIFNINSNNSTIEYVCPNCRTPNPVDCKECRKCKKNNNDIIKIVLLNAQLNKNKKENNSNKTYNHYIQKTYEPTPKKLDDNSFLENKILKRKIQKNDEVSDPKLSKCK